MILLTKLDIIIKIKKIYKIYKLIFKSIFN